MGKIKTAKTVAKVAAPIAAKGIKAVADRRKKDIQHQNELLEQINEKLEKKLSLKEVLKRGIVRGIGAAIGATIIAGIAFSILGRAVNSVDDIPIIRDIIDTAKLEKNL